MSDVVMVFTSKPLETMIQEGGSGYWSANRKRLQKCEYLVATKSNKLREHFPSNRDIKQGSAFLVGKVTNIVDLPSGGRLLIQISEYAEVNQPKVWTGNRNPVAYTTTDALEKEHGLDIESLEWKEFPTSDAAVDSPDKVGSDVKALTIEEAKAGLAKMLGISASCIEITIKA